MSPVVNSSREISRPRCQTCLELARAGYLACLPVPATTFTSAEFAEAVAVHLCIPSPACSTRLGEVMKGRRHVDLFGDEVVNAQLAGDGFRNQNAT